MNMPLAIATTRSNKRGKLPPDVLLMLNQIPVYIAGNSETKPKMLVTDWSESRITQAQGASFIDLQGRSAVIHQRTNAWDTNELNRIDPEKWCGLFNGYWSRRFDAMITACKTAIDAPGEIVLSHDPAIYMTNDDAVTWNFQSNGRITVIRLRFAFSFENWEFTGSSIQGSIPTNRELALPLNWRRRK